MLVQMELVQWCCGSWHGVLGQWISEFWMGLWSNGRSCWEAGPFCGLHHWCHGRGEILDCVHGSAVRLPHFIVKRMQLTGGFPSKHSLVGVRCEMANHVSSI
jgi:hypothetical protein